MKYRVVIKDLRLPQDSPVVVIGDSMSQKDAAAMQRRFTKLKWDERRPGVYTVDNIALCVEPMPNKSKLDELPEEELGDIIESLSTSLSRCLVIKGGMLAIMTLPDGKILGSGATMRACIDDYRRKEADGGKV